MQLHQIAWIVAVVCSSFATLVSIWNIYFHLNHYTEPPVQRHLVRIILMIPVCWNHFCRILITVFKVYSIDSMLGILIYKQSIYFDLLRDCYEAWVIYQFFRLLLNYLGEAATIVRSQAFLKLTLHHYVYINQLEKMIHYCYCWFCLFLMTCSQMARNGWLKFLSKSLD